MTLFGPRWPLSKGNKDTFKLYENVKEQINFYLKNLLLTSPGENISDPRYGIGIRNYLFDMNDDYTRSRMESAIYSGINKYIPYIGVSDIQVVANGKDIDSGTLTIRIVYSIPGDVVNQVFELDLNEDTTRGFY